MLAVATEEQSCEPAETLSFTAPAFEPGRYRVACLSPVETDGEVRNWTLKQLDHPAFKARLLNALPHERPRRYFAPTVDRMSGATQPQEAFTILYPLSRNCIVQRPGFRHASNEKVACDGTSVGRHDGFLMSAGGCPLIVVSGTTHEGEEICLAAHAGRESLVDPFFTRSKPVPRPHTSGVNTLVAYAEVLGARPEDLTLRSFYSLPWHTFTHALDDPKYGERNTLRYEYLRGLGMAGVFLERDDGVLCLSLSMLIKLQAERLGVGKIEVGECTLPENGPFAYTSHANPALSGSMRNLVYLVRK